jgi:hypothetical protein
VKGAHETACDVLGERRYAPDPLLNPGKTFIDPSQIPTAYAPNPYMSLAAGNAHVLREGVNGEETTTVHVTGLTREILGVPCRVVLDAVFRVSGSRPVTYEPVEFTHDWLAQDSIGNVYYCGENVQSSAGLR